MSAPSTPSKTYRRSREEDRSRRTRRDVLRQEMTTRLDSSNENFDTPLDLLSTQPPRWIYDNRQDYLCEFDNSFSLSPTPTRYYDTVEEIAPTYCPYGTPDSSMFYYDDDENFANAAGFAYDVHQIDEDENPRREKGKKRAEVQEGDELVEDGQLAEQDDPNALTQEDKLEQSRRDHEAAIQVFVEELREMRYSDKEIDQWLFENAVQQQQIECASSFPLSRCEKPEDDASLDPYIRARQLLDSFYNRPLQPAFGPTYVPEPSTSYAGSPVIAARRASASSWSGTSNGSCISRTSTESTHEYAVEDEVQRAVVEVLDATFEANKAELLAELEKTERENERLRLKAEKAKKGGWQNLLGAAGTSFGWPGRSFQPSRGESGAPYPAPYHQEEEFSTNSDHGPHRRRRRHSHLDKYSSSLAH